MPINRVKDSQGRTRYEFEFSRRVQGSRQRARKLLPATWSRAQADAFDRQESARLYAQASGIEARSFTIDQAVARYLDERACDLKYGRGIAQELAGMAPYYLGQPLDTLSDVAARYTKENRADLAPATIRNRLRYLTAACRWSWKRHNMGSGDPAARVVMPAVANEKKVFLNRRQMLQLARNCGSWEVRAMIRISFYSGMRLGEIQRARVAGECWVLDDTKNGEPRIVPMDPRCRPYSDYSWPSKGMVAYWVRKARTGLDLPEGVTFHTMRHSSASALIRAGVSIYTTGAVLGHKSVASMKRYSHLDVHSLRDAVARIGR